MVDLIRPSNDPRDPNDALERQKAEILAEVANAKPFVLKKAMFVPIDIKMSARELSTRMAGSSTQAAAAALRRQQSPETKSLLDMIEILQKRVAELEKK